MVLNEIGQPLALTELPQPTPGKGQLLIRVLTCGIWQNAIAPPCISDSALAKVEGK